MSDSKTYSLIHWIEIYQVDSIIWPSNKWGQVFWTVFIYMMIQRTIHRYGVTGPCSLFTPHHTLNLWVSQFLSVLGWIPPKIWKDQIWRVGQEKMVCVQSRVFLPKWQILLLEVLHFILPASHVQHWWSSTNVSPEVKRFRVRISTHTGESEENIKQMISYFCLWLQSDQVLIKVLKDNILKQGPTH